MGAVPHPAWLSTVATAGGYLVILVVMTALLFIVPYLVFVAL